MGIGLGFGVRIGVCIRVGVRCNGEQPRRKAGEHAAEAHGEIGSKRTYA